MVSGANLILPKKYEKQEMEDKEGIKALIKSEIDRCCSENSHRKDPYFILYKTGLSNQHESVFKRRIRVSDKFPMLWTNCMVFWVDNSRGLCTWICAVDKHKKIKFNKPFAEKAKGILRSAAG